MAPEISTQSRDDRTEHLCLLFLAAAVLIGSFWLQFGDNGALTVTIPLAGTGVILPDSCWSRTIFGISCPGCGLTRSFVAMAHGGIASAFKFHPFGPVLFAVCCLQIPYRVLIILGNQRVKRMADHLDVITWLIIAGLLGLWAFRIVADSGLCDFSS